jgi:predicted nucleotidyltransferase component of viral defense system
MKDLIQKQLEKYDSKTEQDEENALKEITQEICLHALSRAGFFEVATFQGGTCLRIVHGVDRFSEDLDFSLRRHQKFDLVPYLNQVARFMSAYGYELEITGEEKAERSVQTRFLKDDSIKRIVSFTHLRDLRKKINIKIEVDTNPPLNANDEAKFLDFPTDYSILCHDLPTLFAGKIHAILCRPYDKGRDWYDFNWYLTQRVEANYEYLGAALRQAGPWKGKKLAIDKAWLIEALSQKINQVKWQNVVDDVSPFIKPDKIEEIEKLWSAVFFEMKLKKYS